MVSSIVQGAVYGAVIGGVAGKIFTHRPVRVASAGMFLGVATVALGVFFGSYGFYAGLAYSTFSMCSLLNRANAQNQRHLPVPFPENRATPT